MAFAAALGRRVTGPLKTSVFSTDVIYAADPLWGAYQIQGSSVINGCLVPEMNAHAIARPKYQCAPGTFKEGLSADHLNLQARTIVAAAPFRYQQRLENQTAITGSFANLPYPDYVPSYIQAYQSAADLPYADVRELICEQHRAFQEQRNILVRGIRQLMLGQHLAGGAAAEPSETANDIVTAWNGVANSGDSMRRAIYCLFAQIQRIKDVLHEANREDDIAHIIHNVQGNLTPEIISDAQNGLQSEFMRLFHDYMSNMYTPIGVMRDMKLESRSSMTQPSVAVIVTGTLSVPCNVYNTSEDNGNVRPGDRLYTELPQHCNFKFEPCDEHDYLGQRTKALGGGGTKRPRLRLVPSAGPPDPSRMRLRRFRHVAEAVADRVSKLYTHSVISFPTFDPVYTDDDRKDAEKEQPKALSALRMQRAIDEATLDMGFTAFSLYLSTSGGLRANINQLQNAIKVVQESSSFRRVLLQMMWMFRANSPELQRRTQDMYKTLLPLVFSEYQILRNREFGIVRDSAKQGELMTVTLNR